MKATYERILQGDYLSRLEMKQLAGQFFEADAEEKLIKDILLALHARQETAEELAGVVDALMERATSYPTVPFPVFDMCGTGGDQSGSFNISTTAAFVTSGAGVRVAKHGNRSISSRSGSADVLAALGLELTVTPVESAHLLETTGLTFLFAPDVHPAMRVLQPIRKAIGKPTLFNLIGPLANPYPLTHQLIGVYREDYQQTLAEAARLLGRKRAVIVTGEGCLDEASLDGTTRYTVLHDSEIMTHTLTAEQVGLSPLPREAIAGGDAEQNAHILRAVLNGEPSAYLDTTLLNSGLALFAAGAASSVKEGIETARESIQSGKALHQLLHYPTAVEVTS